MVAPGSEDGRGHPGEGPRANRSFSSFRSSASPWPDPLTPEAYHGLAGDIVHTIEPESEADPVALLIQVLTTFGNVIGRNPHQLIEADRHHTNLFAALVGETSKARKGTSWGQVCRLFEQAEEHWAKNQIATGLSSGEGLIWAVRDPITTRMPVKEKGKAPRFEEVEADPGVSDKRILIVEPEFASTLRVMERKGNTLSPIIRQAWDSGNLRSLVKHAPARATDAHISVLAHITRNELRRYLDRTEAGNGFANRFLWALVRRSKALPDGGWLDDTDLDPLGQRLATAIAFARDIDALTLDNEARVIWHAVYLPLSEGKPGLLGAVISRAEAQVKRIASIYALLDCSLVIRGAHLLAALALWDYCEASARHIFGDALGDPVADELLCALRAAGPAGLTRTEIRDLFGRNRGAAEIGRALGVLLEPQLARFTSEPSDRDDGRGRPVERWFATMEATTNTTNTTKIAEDGDLRSSMSFPSYLELGKLAAHAAATGENDVEVIQ